MAVASRWCRGRAGKSGNKTGFISSFTLSVFAILLTKKYFLAMLSVAVPPGDAVRRVQPERCHVGQARMTKPNWLANQQRSAIDTYQQAARAHLAAVLEFVATTFSVRRLPEALAKFRCSTTESCCIAERSSLWTVMPPRTAAGA